MFIPSLDLPQILVIVAHCNCERWGSLSFFFDSVAFLLPSGVQLKSSLLDGFCLNNSRAGIDFEKRNQQFGPAV